MSGWVCQRGLYGKAVLLGGALFEVSSALCAIHPSRACVDLRPRKHILLWGEMKEAFGVLIFVP